ncbi:DUF2474 family protein [Pseudoruegeria sp. SK021]|nr:DUF2474 family protein [Pseudoruegeria sp. SK021]OSP54543.1 hypothetical protein BV911_11790 [Pseudoruegeria sp. SK021]
MRTRNRMAQIAWFVGIWLASVAILAVVAYGIKLML